MKLAVNCMVRNEEATVFEALMSAGQVADEIVFIDTGSTDRTVEAARAAIDLLGKPSHFEVLTNIPDLTGYSELGGSFCPSYQLSDVRNMMIEASKSKWVWVVDGDEVYTDQDAHSVRSWIDGAAKDADAGFVPLIWLCFDGKHQIPVGRSEPPIYPRSGRLFRKVGRRTGTVDLRCKGHFPGESYFRSNNHQIVEGDPSAHRLVLPDGGYRHYEAVLKPYRRRVKPPWAPFPGRLPESFARRPQWATWRRVQGISVPGPHSEINNPPDHMRI